MTGMRTTADVRASRSNVCMELPEVEMGINPTRRLAMPHFPLMRQA